MRILEYPKEYEETCDKCGAKLAYTKQDIKEKYYIGYKYIKCPICNNEIMV